MHTKLSPRKPIRIIIFSLLISSLALVSNGTAIASVPTGAFTQFTGITDATYWKGVASSSDGSRIAAISTNGQLWTSTNSGTTWESHTALNALNLTTWQNIVTNASGETLTVASGNGSVYSSGDFGTTWTATNLTGLFGVSTLYGVTTSADGKILAVSDFGTNKVLVSTNSGLSWSNEGPSGPVTGNFWNVVLSGDGLTLAAIASAGNIWTATYSPTTTPKWTWHDTGISSSSGFWRGLSISSNGNFIAASAYNGKIYVSSDSGTTWSVPSGFGTLGNINWQRITMSQDGRYISATTGSYIYSSGDFGATVTRFSAPENLYSILPLDTSGISWIAGSAGTAGSQPGGVYKLTITWPLAAPAFTISSSAETKTVGSALTGYTITSTGGLIDSYTVSNSSSLTSLGLTFDTSTGLISGTPSVVTSSTAFTITALNATGSANQNFTLTVNAVPVAPAQPVEPPPPAQTSVIADLSLTGSGSTEGGNLFIVNGTFSAPILKITIDGKELPKSSWSQNGIDLILTMPSSAAGTVSIQIYNGQVPVLPVIKYSYVEVAPVQTPVVTPATPETSTVVTFGFNYNSALIKSDINSKLKALGIGNNSEIEIVGYAQPTAPKDDRRISLARALKIQQLIAKAFPQAQSKILAMGSKKQSLCAATQNRCVLVKIIS